MREFVYYSRTSPAEVKDEKENRIDIVVRTIISAFFLSHTIRNDTILHIIFDGSEPQHLELMPVIKGKEGRDKIFLNKGKLKELLMDILKSYDPEEKVEVFPGYFIEKKGLSELLAEKKKENKIIVVLDKGGEDIRDFDLSNSVFVIGDHKGLPGVRADKTISVGSKDYFASHVVTIIHNELDRIN